MGASVKRWELSKTSHHTAPPCPSWLLIGNKRRELGLSQGDHARTLYVTRASISELERGVDGQRLTPRVIATLHQEGSTSAIRPKASNSERNVIGAPIQTFCRTKEGASSYL